MASFNDAERVVVNPIEGRALRADARFVPVCQYPVHRSYRPGDFEIGMLADVGSNGEIKSVSKRIIEEVNVI